MFEPTIFLICALLIGIMGLIETSLIKEYVYVNALHSTTTLIEALWFLTNIYILFTASHTILMLMSLLYVFFYISITILYTKIAGVGNLSDRPAFEKIPVPLTIKRLAGFFNIFYIIASLSLLIYMRL